MTQQQELFSEPKSGKLSAKTVAAMQQHAVRLQNGTWTVQNQVSGEHRTFKINTQPKDCKFAPGKRVVSVMTGPDNENSFTGFGFVYESGQGSRIAVWSRLQGSPGQWSHYQFYADMLHVLLGGYKSECGKTLKDYTIEGSGNCYICNHKLTNPISLETGVGPVCAGKL